MELITACVPQGLAVDVVPEARTAVVQAMPVVEVPSESYLRIIDARVGEAGGWQNVKAWYLSRTGQSCTSVRGLMTLAATLAGLHHIPLYVFSEHPAQATRATEILEPEYASEPNIQS